MAKHYVVHLDGGTYSLTFEELGNVPPFKPRQGVRANNCYSGTNIQQDDICFVMRCMASEVEVFHARSKSEYILPPENFRATFPSTMFKNVGVGCALWKRGKYYYVYDRYVCDELGGVWTVPNGVDDLNSFYPNSRFVQFAEVLP
mgnify:CR=1 FL=1